MSYKLRPGDAYSSCSHPFYSQKLHAEALFLALKAIELRAAVTSGKAKIDISPHADMQAVVQHFGQRSDFLDFTEDVWVSAYFATHDNNFEPLREGIGVIYALDVRAIPVNLLRENVYVAGEGARRQRLWSVRVAPDSDLLSTPCLVPYYFRQDRDVSVSIGERAFGKERFDQRSPTRAWLARFYEGKEIALSALEQYRSISEDGRPVPMPERGREILESAGYRVSGSL